jgi:superfamily II DNA helicase RecQ
MKFKFFTIPTYSSESVQEELNSFCASRRIIHVEKEFVDNGDRSFWAICVSYFENENSLAATRKGKVDYREVLDEKDFAVFAKLRTLRKTLAEKEGIPAYALFTNEQLASIVRQRVTSLAALAEIDGVGKGRIDKYGKEFLTILQNEFKDVSATNSPGATYETKRD